MRIRAEVIAPLVVTAVITGVGLGLSAQPEPKSDTTRDGVRFTVPHGYAPAELSIDRLAGALGIADALAYAPAPGQPGQTAIIGVTLPGGLQLTRGQPITGLSLSGHSELVLLGSDIAVRGRGSAVDENHTRWHVTVYVVAGAQRDITLACASQDAILSEEDACDRLATTLRIPAGFGAVPEAPTLRAYREQFEANTRAHEHGVAVLRRELAQAHTPQGQAWEARGLAALCVHAARGLAGLPPDPLAIVPQQALATALYTQASAYWRLARAATAENRAEYSRARGAIEREEPAVHARELALGRVTSRGP
jgi:hypothetical protein